MAVFYDNEKRIFKLDTKDTSYVIKIYNGNYLLGLYYGKKIPDIPFEDYDLRDWFTSFSPMNKNMQNLPFSADVDPMEYSGFGTGDFRKAAVEIKNADGNSCTDFRYVSHRFFKGKRALSGLPASYANEVEAESLEIETEDKVTHIKAYLLYTVFENKSIMTKSVRFENHSENKVFLEKAYSASYNFNTMDYDMIHLYGSWNAERNYRRTALDHGQLSVSSSRGSSSHYHSPNVALAKKNATEDFGEVYGFSFVYSGSFDITADCDYYETVRLNIGINPDGFSWCLNAGEAFQTPEVVSVYTDKGVGEMSREFHDFFSEHLIPQKFTEEKRPLLINSWEAAFMNIDENVLYNFAVKAKESGIEMLVMDDGWFGRRNDDTTSLGDWYVNSEKFPGGLSSLISKINGLGMKFGIWFEPEMISPDSDVFRAHPDWHIHVKGREESIGRSQYVIDMTRADVREYVYNSIADILSNNNIEYLKWDFNRNLTEAGSALLPAEQGGEVFHRFVLGTYEVLSKLRRNFPDLLIESCSGGGGRFDAGMLFYTPQIWTSDNTDPIQRIDIQFGTSLFFPASTMGAHVSLNPRTGFETKGNVALWGTFGYELDPGKLSKEDCELIKKQVEEYHKTYDLIRKGDLYRIESPWENNYRVGWQFVSKDKREVLYTQVIMIYYRIMKRIIRFKGLDSELIYTDTATGRKYSGAYLMNVGINAVNYPRGTGESFKIHLIAQ